MRRLATRALGLAVLLLLVVVAQAFADPPPNDNRDSAQALSGLPAAVSGTKVGATVETNEPPSGCAQTTGSVWYSVSFGGQPPSEVGIKVLANGDLDAAVDVFQRQRSQRGYRSAPVINGTAVVPFVPPALGRWRTTVVYNGTRSAAPAASGWANLLVAGPLTQ